MTTTISDPSVRYASRDGRRQLRTAELRRAELRAETGEAGPGTPDPVVSDKLRVPQPGVPLVQRPRVTRLIERAAGRRVVLVTGPSGAGKTVACALWAAAQPAADRVAWLSLDHGDRSSARLWASLRSALAGIGGMPGDIAGDLSGPGDRAFGLRLAEVAQRLAAPVTLILDDISNLAGAETLPAVDDLVRHAPPTLRLVLAGRHSAGLQVARLRVSGDLAEIGPGDLACTADEASAYFAMLGLELPAAQRDELLRRTEGWMAGIRLAAMRAEPGRWATAVLPISGEEPPVADYLLDEVLAGQPDDRRLFLLRTSVADVICGELAGALTSQPDGAAVLDQLCRENIMITTAEPPAQGDGGAGYRYHPLLLDLLRAQLRRELPEEVPALHRRAARWQAAHGRPADAIRSAARAADWDFAARVLAEAGPALLLPGPAADLEPVLAAIPGGRLASDAPVAGALAAAGLRTGDSCAAALHLANARRALDRCPPTQRRTIAPWLHALTMMNADPRETGSQDLTEEGQAIARSQHAAHGIAEQPGMGLLWCALGVSALALADPGRARDCFATAARQLADRHREFARRAAGWQALAEALCGDLPSAERLIAAADGTDRATALLTGLAAAHVHWARDEPAAALRALGRPSLR